MGSFFNHLLIAILYLFIISLEIFLSSLIIINSFVTTLLKFPDESSFVANALIVTARVCIPAFPPIDATIGIKNANATICSIVAPNILITHVAIKAVNKFSNNQLNLLLVFFNTPSVSYTHLTLPTKA